MKAHRKQFLIAKEPKQINEDWKTVPLAAALFLSHCPELTVARVEDLDGEAWHLLGLAVQTDKDRKDPLTEISRSSTSQVRNIYKSWAGRWVLLGAGEVHMDCCGLLGCFYAAPGDARWVSSSLAILQELGGFTPRPEVLKHRTGMEWFPLPFSRLEGVSKLLPSQILHLNTFHLEARDLPKPIPGLAYDEMIDKLEERIKYALANACRPAQRVIAQLTAGYDSRLVLATMHALGIKGEAYTTEGYYIPYADVTMPPKLAKAAGYRHRYIKRGLFSEEKAALYDQHTGCNSADIDRMKFSEGQWDPFGKGDLILRGSVFEAGRCQMWKKLGTDFKIESILNGLHPQYKQPFSIKAFSEWMAWVEQTPTEGLDWRDRIYLEQRVGGWLSAIEQSLDLTGTDRFNIANCHAIISLMLSAPVEKRKGFLFYIYLIKRMCPVLLKYPFNAPEPKFKKMQKRLIKVSKMPLRALYAKLKRKVRS